MNEAFHYLVVPGDQGGVERAPGEAIGLDLATMLSEGTPPVSIVLTIVSALAELIGILEEDEITHGALDLECIFFDETGTLGVEGFETGEPGADRYALAGIALELFGAPRFTSPGSEAHEEAVLDAILAADLSGIDEAIIGEVQWFLARLLDLDPYHRPDPASTWRSFIAFASTTPGPDWFRWCPEAVVGKGARRGYQPERARQTKDTVRTASTTPPAPGGGNATAYWTNEELDAMAAGLDTAPRPRRCDGVADKRQQTLLRAGDHGRRSRKYADEVSVRGVISSPTADTVFQEGASAASEERRQFSIEQCLGRGGFGEVYLCTMSSAAGMRSKVAVKVLREGVDPRAQAVRRLRDEARVLGSLQHPAILNALDLVVLDERVAMVTEYVPGADLDVCLEGDNPPSLRALLSILAITAEALDASWNASVDGSPLRLVHRDIKPSNIRIGTHGQVKLLDFGIAKFASTREAKTQNNQMIGTLSYMAPERLASATDHPAGDVYAMGAILFEALAGYGLWSETTPRQQYMLSMVDTEHDGHVTPRIERLEAPEEVRQVLLQTLAYEPESRPTAGELAQRLEDLSDDIPGRNLRRWARDHTWPTPASFDAELVGRTLTEGRSMGRTSATMAGTTDVVQKPSPAPAPSASLPAPAAPLPGPQSTSSSKYIAPTLGDWNEPEPAPPTPAPLPTAVFAEPVADPAPAPADPSPTPTPAPTPAPPPPPVVSASIAPEPSSVLSMPIDGGFEDDFDSDPIDSDEWQPQRRSKALPILIALGGGLLLFVLTVGGSVAAGLAVLSGDSTTTVQPQPTGPTPDPTPPGPANPDAPVPVEPVEPGQPVQPGTAAPSQPVPGQPEPTQPEPTQPTPNNDGTASLQPVPGPTPGSIIGQLPDVEPEVPEPGPSSTAEAACGELVALEPSAALGRLTNAQQRCLTEATTNAAMKMTDRQKHGRVLLANAKANCAAGKPCPAYESVQDQYFRDLGRSDPNLMFTYATHLFTTAGSNLQRAQKSSLWAGRALERKGAWKGRTYTQRTLELKKIRAMVANKAYVASPTEANRRNVRDRSVEWAEQRLTLNLDATAAFAMCASATGSMESCDKRVSTDAATEEITLLSVPPRAKVFVDGKEQGTTPKRIALTHGSHEIEMRFEDTTSKKSIRVGAGQPVRWQWLQAGDAWKSSL